MVAAVELFPEFLAEPASAAAGFGADSAEFGTAGALTGGETTGGGAGAGSSSGLGLKVRSGAWVEAGSVAGDTDAADPPDDAGALVGATTGSVCPRLRPATTTNREASFDIGFIPTL